MLRLHIRISVLNVIYYNSICTIYNIYNIYLCIFVIMHDVILHMVCILDVSQANILVEGGRLLFDP